MPYNLLYHISAVLCCPALLEPVLSLMGGRVEDFHFQVLAGSIVLVYIVGAVGSLGQEVLFDAGGVGTI